MNLVDYTILSMPAFVSFECPHCHEDVEVSFEEVDYETGYWEDGGFVNCPECGEEVALGDFEYD